MQQRSEIDRRLKALEAGGTDEVMVIVLAALKGEEANPYPVSGYTTTDGRRAWHAMRGESAEQLLVRVEKDCAAERVVTVIEQYAT